jgi:hypothetical protein
MRQGQQNRRGRGRNRKSQNPLTRSFESNGPDTTKLRGTPSHIAEKYISLARDALSSGDPVLAENYLQHAEHYNRIIMTYREQQLAQGEGMNGSGRQRGGEHPGEAGDDEYGDADDLAPGHEPKPGFAHEAANDAGEERGGQPERSERGQRRGGGRGLPRRRRQSASGNGAGDHDDDNQGDTASAPARNRRRDAFSDDDDQPDFLKRPVRRPRSQSSGDDQSASSGDDVAGASADEAAE